MLILRGCGRWFGFVLCSLVATLVLTGCGMGPAAVSGGHVELTGKAYGGQQPIAGMHVYLMAVAVSGSVASGNGYGNASVSLLSGTGHSDAVGGYVLTDTYGNFDISGDYNSCNVAGASSNSEVYLYGAGGNPGSGTNSAASLLALLGPCYNQSSSTTVVMNEVTTVAMAYALAGFETNATHISIPAYTTGTKADSLASTDLQLAAYNASLLVDTTSGTALSSVAVTDSASNGQATGVAPQQTVNTLGNILSACINTADQSESPTVLSSNCQALLNTATSNGIPVGSTGAGTAAGNVSDAAINIAKYPGSNVATLTGLIPKTPPFSPALSVATTPNDLTLALVYSGGGLAGWLGGLNVTIDAAGTAWVSGQYNNVVTIQYGVFSSYAIGTVSNVVYATTPQEPAIDGSGNFWFFDDSTNLREVAPYVGIQSSDYSMAAYGGGVGPYQLSFDGSGDLWTSDGNGAIELSSKGTLSGYSCGTNCGVGGVAVDGTGRVWVAGVSELSVLNSSGTLVDVSPYQSSTYFGLGPQGQNHEPATYIAMNSSNQAWVLNANQVTKVTAGSSGATYAGPYNLSPSQNVYGMALDGAGNVWGIGVTGLLELASSGTQMSPAGGYQSASAFTSIAVDGAGDVWLPVNNGSAGDTVMEVIGVATPVVTPVVAGLSSPYTPAGRP